MRLIERGFGVGSIGDPTGRGWTGRAKGLPTRFSTLEVVELGSVVEVLVDRTVVEVVEEEA
jgi:hypothetical protein